MSHQSIALKIKTLRVRLNMSQERFGKKIGVTGKTVSAYECGRCIPTLKVLEKVARAYGAGFVTLADDTCLDMKAKIATLKATLDELEAQLQ